MDDRWFIHRHLAAEMDGRLQILTRKPQRILLAGADGDHSRRLLAARYPQAAFSEYDPRPEFLAEAAAGRKGGWFSRLAGKTAPAQHCQSLCDPLPPMQADMLWSNLALATESDPLPVFDAWAGGLKTDGLLFFSHFGIDSLPEVRALLAENGIACAASALIDMHDLGDMLADHGFYDPVMDSAKLVLEYQSAESFCRDMDTLSLWQALQPENESAARRLAEQAVADGRLARITLETVFGHAVKKLVLPQGENLVQFFPKGGKA